MANTLDDLEEMEDLQPRKTRRQALRQMSRLHHKLGSSPLIMFFLGALVLLLWLAGTVVQIQTSEYLALGNQTRVAGVAWSILTQPFQMISGQAPVQYVTAWLYGWTIEVVTLVFALALSVAVVKISTVNPRFGKWFVVLGFVLIALNSWADYSSSPGSNPLVQFLIALAIGIIVTIGLPLGVGLIEHGVEEL
jgi:membrane-associated HD superfamily phosphohydrolase